MQLFIPRHNVLQHRLLGLLVDKLEQADRAGINVNDVHILIQDIIKQLDISEAKFWAIVSSPGNNDELQIHREDSKGFIYITSKGDEAYHEKKYLKAGRQLVLNQINDFTKIIIPLIAIVLSIISFYISMTDRVDNRRTIDKLKADLQKMQIKMKK